MDIPTLKTVDWSAVRLHVLLATEQPCNHCGTLLLHHDPIVLDAKSLPKKQWWLSPQVEVFCDPICKELQNG